MAIPDDDFMPFRTDDEYVGYKLKSTGEIVIPSSSTLYSNHLEILYCKYL